MKSIIDKKQAYSFHDYFNLNPPIKDLLAYFGYSYQRQHYKLPQLSHFDAAPFTHLKQQLDSNLRRVSLANETARREALIAPIILELARHLEIDVEIEYPLVVSEQLKGKLDYLLRTEQNLLVVEAKKGDIERGFIQLAVELIALDQWLDEATEPLYGLVTMGNVWQFGLLRRHHKQVIQDLALYRVPADLDELLPILIGILA